MGLRFEALDEKDREAVYFAAATELQESGDPRLRYKDKLLDILLESLAKHGDMERLRRNHEQAIAAGDETALDVPIALSLREVASRGSNARGH